jgi:hypothetical protein
MKWQGYLLFGFLSLVLAGISMMFWMVNPVTWLLLFLAAAPLRLLGYHPPVEGWSALGSVMFIGALWPLTLAPLHWLSFRAFHWGKWAYAGMLLTVNVILTMVFLAAKEGT